MKLPEHLVLSGGGIYGIHMLKTLHCIENKIGFKLSMMKLKSISTASVGSLLGCAILLGYEMRELLDKIIINLDPKLCINFNLETIISDFGFCSQEYIEKHIKNMIDLKYPNRSETLTFRDLFEETQCTFYVSVTNLTHQKSELWSHITHPDVTILKALKISCCIPFVFIPIFHNDEIYIDGGILNNFPHDKVMEHRDKTLGITPYNECSNVNNVNNLEDYSSIILRLIYDRWSIFHTSLCNCNTSNTIFIKETVNPTDMARLDSNDLYNIFIKYDVDLSQLMFFSKKK